jgi:hypothetical protein
MAALVNLDFNKLKEVIKRNVPDEIENFLEENNLVIKDNKIFPKNKDDVSYAIAYWDKRQLVTKINLNSLYGAILNPGCRFADKRIGQSTTLTGRSIAKHMDSHVNECITGEYNHVGDAVIYGDSVTGDTLIRTDTGTVAVADLYNQCLEHESFGDKEYGLQSSSKAAGFNAFEDTAIMSEISYVMRHKTKKKLYKIELENGNTVTVTEDHSIMVDRSGFLLEITPDEILDTDLIICLSSLEKQTVFQ